MTIGDTLGKFYGDVVVTNIDSVESCGKFHKRYIFDDLVNLVEGIGYSNGLLGFKNWPPAVESYYELVCYAERDNNLCSPCKLLLNNQSKIKSRNSIRIYPNPVIDQIHIEADEDIFQVLIFDLSGIKLYQSGRIRNNSFIINSSLNSGLYLLLIEYQNTIYCKKFCVL